MTRLGVNIDHVATLRNARGEFHPDPVKAAKFAKKVGADSITIHLREDKRHINDLDAKKICSIKNLLVNLEISINPKIIKTALKIKPNFVCIVPENRKEITTEGGLNLKKYKDRIKKIVSKFKKKNIRTSLFINPSLNDIIISSKSNNRKAFDGFIDELIKNNIIIEVLSRGKTKSLTVTKLPGKPARRVDFLYTPAEEYPFAVLYFTGSKNFNTAQRQRALKLGYSLNEHGLYHMNNGKKADKVNHVFNTEEDIFKYLGMEYVEPDKRIDNKSIIKIAVAPKKTVKKKLKIKTIKKNSPIILNYLKRKVLD